MIATLILWGTALASEWIPDEGEAVEKLLRLDSMGKWIEAKRSAKAMLIETERNFVAHHVLGRALWRGDGDYAQAVLHLRRALEIYAEDYDGLPNPPWRLESEGWYSLRSLVGDMGNFEEELKLIDVFNERQKVYEERYGERYRDMVGERGWPLMKLERYAEAQHWAYKALEVENSNWQTSLGWNVLCATAGELGDREAALEACEAGLEHGRSNGYGISIDASNASNAAFSMFDYDKAEGYAKEATQAADGTTVSAWLNLLQYYLGRGQGERALSALEGLNASLAAEEPQYRVQKRADVDAAFSMLLLSAGEGERALVKIERSLRIPDRRGTISTSEEQSRGSHTLIRLVIRKLIKQRAAERVASKPFWKRFIHWCSSLLPDALAIRDASSIRSVLQDEKRLIATFRTYVDKGLNVIPPWLIPELIPIIGTGVSREAIRLARETEKHPMAEGFFLAYETELAALSGDWAVVVSTAERSLSLLSEAEGLLRARLNARRGEALLKLDRFEDAMTEFMTAVEIDPGVFRRLDISLPVVLSGDAASGPLASALLHTSRFRQERKGFGLQVSVGQTCLLGPLGEMISCVAAPERGEQTAEQHLETTLDNFLSQAFGLRTGTTGAEWNSLDGTTTASQSAVRRELERVLQGE